ncbi:hypothetical protein ACOME3_001524 [Neoechinorhynchus agilis]
MSVDPPKEEQIIQRPSDINEFTKFLSEGPRRTPKIVVFVEGDSELSRKIIEDLKPVDIICVDISLVKEVQSRYAISAIPTVVSICYDKEVARFTGVQSSEFYDEFLKASLRKTKLCKPTGVVEITSLGELKELIDDLDEEKRLLVIDFYANWCLPCRLFSPLIEHLSTERTDVMFGKIDIGSPFGVLLSEEFNISALPTVFLLANKDQIQNDENIELICMSGDVNCYVKIASLAGFQNQVNLNTFIDIGLEKIRGKIGIKNDLQQQNTEDS